MAEQRRTSFSGVMIAALLAVMLLPGEYTVGSDVTIPQNQGQCVRYTSVSMKMLL